MSFGQMSVEQMPLRKVGQMPLDQMSVEQMP